jgi:thioredoxin-like negative regulator of GroEL
VHAAGTQPAHRIVIRTAAKEYRAALEQFLAIIQKDNQYRKVATRKTMVSVFGMVGRRSELADEYRDQLTRLLDS